LSVGELMRGGATRAVEWALAGGMVGGMIRGSAARPSSEVSLPVSPGVA